MFQQTQAEVSLRNQRTGVSEQVAAETEELMIENDALERRRVQND